MKRRVYRASALAGWIGVIVLFVLDPVGQRCAPRCGRGGQPVAGTHPIDHRGSGRLSDRLAPDRVSGSGRADRARCARGRQRPHGRHQCLSGRRLSGRLSHHRRRFLERHVRGGIWRVDVAQHLGAGPVGVGRRAGTQRFDLSGVSRRRGNHFQHGRGDGVLAAGAAVHRAGLCAGHVRHSHCLGGVDHL